jgi:hypothetical protein
LRAQPPKLPLLETTPTDNISSSGTRIVPTSMESNPTVQPSPKKPYDIMSREGKFGWFAMGNEHFPYIFRTTENTPEQYVSVRMVETKLLAPMLRQLPAEVITRHPVSSYRMTVSESKLLNDINSFHSGCFFGTEPFTEADVVLKVTDAEAFFAFLNDNMCQAGQPNHHSYFPPSVPSPIVTSGPNFGCSNLAAPSASNSAHSATCSPHPVPPPPPIVVSGPNFGSSKMSAPSASPSVPSTKASATCSPHPMPPPRSVVVSGPSFGSSKLPAPSSSSSSVPSIKASATTVSSAPSDKASTVSTAAVKVSTEEKPAARAAAPRAAPPKPFPIRLNPLPEPSADEGLTGPPYRLLQVFVRQIRMTCINARAHDFKTSEVMMTFPDFARCLCQGLTTEGVIQMLQTEIPIPLYQGTG